MMWNYPYYSTPAYFGAGSFISPFVTFLVIILIIVIIFRLFRSDKRKEFIKDVKEWKRGHAETESALDILKRRYAKGEITKAEFESMKKDIS